MNGRRPQAVLYSRDGYGYKLISVDESKCENDNIRTSFRCQSLTSCISVFVSEIKVIKTVHMVEFHHGMNLGGVYRPLLLPTGGLVLRRVILHETTDL
jgi:hypothetical protein